MTDPKVKRFDIDYHTVQLLLNEPFWGHISRRVTKVCTDQVATAGVTVKDGDLRMVYNPGFCSTLVEEEGEKKVIGLLKHEMCHLFYEHVTSRRRDPFLIWNYATDLAINSPRNISREELPNCGLVPGERPCAKDGTPQHDPVADLIAELEPNMSSDYYFEKLREVWPDEPKGGGDGEPGDGEPIDGGGHGPLDDHDGWDAITETDRELIRGKVKQVVKEAVKECDKTNRWGSVSAELRADLRRLISDQVDWRSLLRAFIGRCQRADVTSTRKRRNRKYGLIHPGSKRNYTANILVAVDMSGSVSDAELELLYGELGSLAKRATFTFLPFDSSVDEENMFVWKKGKRVEAKRYRAGGTCFDAPVRFANEHKTKYDALLIMTDGYAPKPGTCLVRSGWIITPDGSMDFETGRSPVIKLQHRAQAA
tara:strand:- start:4325 stop:5596 length:1272 start_codon:yes stop_codon:yes gene_type:complete